MNRPGLRSLLAWMLSLLCLQLSASVGEFQPGSRTAFCLLPWLLLCPWPSVGRESTQGGSAEPATGAFWRSRWPGPWQCLLALGPIALAIELDCSGGARAALPWATALHGLLLLCLSVQLVRRLSGSGATLLFYIYYVLPIAILLGSRMEGGWASLLASLSPLGWIFQRFSEPQLPDGLWLTPLAGLALGAFGLRLLGAPSEASGPGGSA